MRFSDRITLIKLSKGGYNPETGRHEEPKPIKEVIPAHLSTLNTERTNQLFGAINKHILVARVQPHLIVSFDYVEIDGKEHKVMRRSEYRKGVLFLEEGR